MTGRRIAIPPGESWFFAFFAINNVYVAINGAPDSPLNYEDSSEKIL
jgi:hypothetical protein